MSFELIKKVNEAQRKAAVVTPTVVTLFVFTRKLKKAQKNVFRFLKALLSVLTVPHLTLLALPFVRSQAALVLRRVS